MSHRAWWLVISAIVLLCIAVTVQDGLRRAEDRAAREATTAAAPPTNQSGPATIDTGIDAQMQQARNDAMTAAVTVLHTYVAALFKTDRSDADALWVDGHPATHGEADLRTLEGVTGVRVDNGRPDPLDTAPVPTQLRVPVHLRVGGQGPLRHYDGHYDLRREGENWRISGASIDPSPRRR